MVHLFRRAAVALLLSAGFSGGAHAAAHLLLRHVDAQHWRAEYQFETPVSKLDFGPAANVKAWRKQAWRVLTPGLSLSEQNGADVISTGGKPFTTLTVEITPYADYSLSNYVPMNQFTDGGSAIYLGFLNADADGHELALNVQLRGLPGETVIAPQQAGDTPDGYAYFGPAHPVATGNTVTIIDPKTPPGIRAALLDTTAKVAQFYAAVLGRPLQRPFPLLVAVGDLERPGLSIKGGVVNGQVVYRVEGQKLATDSEPTQQALRMLVAHEMAHVWQSQVSRGGFGADEPWVHEGGAEALALAALQGSGIWTAEQVGSHGKKLLDECSSLNGSTQSYRGGYACGYQRFSTYPVAAPALWKRMIARTEQTGEPYSQAMITLLLAAPAP